MSSDFLSARDVARLLNTRLPHVIQLLENGQLTGSMDDAGEWQIPSAAAQQYYVETKIRQAEGMQMMVEETEKLGLYDAQLLR